MTAVAGVSARCQRILDSLPPYYSSDPTIVRVLQTAANEFDRLEALALSVQRGMVPLLSDDEVGLLGVWEGILGLPVEPAGVSLGQRQAALSIALAGRRCRTTAEWVQAVSNGVTGSWSHQVGVPGPGQITVTLPFGAGSYLDGVVRTLLRRLTPANYGLSFGTAGGWIVGVSEVGDDI